MIPRFLQSDRYSGQEWKRIVLFFWLGTLAVVGLSALAMYSIFVGMRSKCDDLHTCIAGLGPFAPFLNILGSLVMVSLSSFTFGALIGFLFGVPRYRSEPESSEAGRDHTQNAEFRARYIPNTNLEQISDWLTKLVVGATLVQLTKIPVLLVDFGHYFTTQPADEHVTVSAGIYFAILGFFVAFFYAGLYLTETLNAPTTFEATVAARSSLAETSTVETLKDTSGDALIQARIALADTRSPVLSQTLTPKDVEFAVNELKRLAERYETIRREMQPGDPRTIQMEGLVSQMRLVAGAAYSEILQFRDSIIAGERLACVVILQIKPNTSYLKWLVDRFRVERPFVQYHAALALRNTGRAFPQDIVAVREAINNAIEIIRPVAGESSDRVQVLSLALSEMPSAS